MKFAAQARSVSIRIHMSSISKGDSPYWRNHHIFVESDVSRNPSSLVHSSHKKRGRSSFLYSPVDHIGYSLTQSRSSILRIQQFECRNYNVRGIVIHRRVNHSQVLVRKSSHNYGWQLLGHRSALVIRLPDPGHKSMKVLEEELCMGDTRQDDMSIHRDDHMMAE